MPPRITQTDLAAANVDDLERLFRSILPKGEVLLTFTDEGVSFSVRMSDEPEKPHAWSQFLSLDDFMEMYYKRNPEDKEEHEKIVLPVPDALRRNI